MLRRTLLGIFTLTLGLSLLGGISLVLAQAVALLIGHGPWLVLLNESAKTPVVVAASVCAVAGYLLGYRTPAPTTAQQQEARR
ncbi:hypothetical protein [Kocuria sp. KH4]